MSIRITSDNSSDELRIDPISKALRATLYNTDGSQVIDELISILNSTSTLLGVSATFNGTFEDVSKFNTMKIVIFSNITSATNGLTVQFSEDGANIYFTKTFTYSTINAGRQIILPIMAKYVRVIYTNNVSAQTTFRLITEYSSRIYFNFLRNSDQLPADFDSPIFRAILSMQGNGVSSPLGVTDTQVTAVGASAGAALTLTIPAGGTGLFQYITELNIYKFNAAALTAAATPVNVTTTNLSSLVVPFPADAALQGTINKEQIKPRTPFKSNTANTATTIVCPVTTGVIWRVTALYYLGT